MVTPMQIDPSRTGLEFRQQSVRLKAIYDVIKSELSEFRFSGSDVEQFEAFSAWLDSRIVPYLTNANAGRLWGNYVTKAYAKGASRSFDEVRLSRVRLDDVEAAAIRKQFVEDFVASSGAKGALFGARVRKEVGGAAEALSTKLARVMSGALLRGSSSRETRADMRREIDDNLTKMLGIARYEVVAAHAAGQLDGFRRLGVTELGVLVEWQTAGDNKVCPRCQAISGRTYKIEEADGLIPLHPFCRCAWTAAGVARGSRGSRTRRGRKR